MPKPCSMTGAISGCFGVMACSGFIAGVWALSWDTSCPNASRQLRTVIGVELSVFGSARDGKRKPCGC